MDTWISLYFNLQQISLKRFATHDIIYIRAVKVGGAIMSLFEPNIIKTYNKGRFASDKHIHLLLNTWKQPFKMRADQIK